MARSGSSAPLPRLLATQDLRAQGREGQTREGCQGRRHGSGVPGVHVRRVRLARPLDQDAKKRRAEAGGGDRVKFEAANAKSYQGAVTQNRDPDSEPARLTQNGLNEPVLSWRATSVSGTPTRSGTESRTAVGMR